ncbi:2,3-dihydro-2,3-dihydroxybenzoate dehydrogenase [Streptomyces physcomitrii]|uniref:2,3-dihydro-2,3-dihydroxybenzoate dehydrogenase n=1 Tax=Streptomyces physcomitrii TaxID=2724184 RepID=A0ABX1H7H0_9ACTN|nr:2,3-dihydro-2,3-dihydroxybenzoate dehydrogenase [Streptomyces physcomitrii]NKI44316.1 2,3-dihydro-2,3-dihydroxybenzoate dehydrogenase [Streptomyces physcomitrii]
MLDSELQGRTALVTGAGRGIGAAVARLLAERGATVLATDRSADFEDPGTAERTGTLSTRPLDVTDPAAVDLLVEEVVTAHGRLDILVNVAGVLRPAPVAELSDEDWASTFAVNSSGVFHTCRAAARVMTGQGRGSIITVGSNAAGVPRTNMAAYAASKAAATHFTRCLGLELAPSGVRCNVVSPGSTDTAMQRQLWATPDAPERVIAGDPAAYRTGIPLGRIAGPEDIAEAVAFLASDRARHITLHDLYVDGGATLKV